MPSINNENIYKIVFDWKVADGLEWVEGYYYAEDKPELISYIQKLREDNEIRNLKVFKTPFKGWEEVIVP